MKSQINHPVLLTTMCYITIPLVGLGVTYICDCNTLKTITFIHSWILGLLAFGFSLKSGVKRAS